MAQLTSVTPDRGPEPTDAALRADIRRLGTQLGNTLVRQHGEDLLDTVQRVRTLTRHLREEGPSGSSPAGPAFDKRVNTELHDLFDDADVALRYEGTSDEVVVEADRDRITQVLLNLLANALKFTPAQDGRVTVTLDSDAGWARVCVQDNGPGIAPEDHELIFDKFHQSRDPRGGKPHGTGLGLPISRQIVAHFGGSLDVDSRPGEGARFCFRLPLPHSGDAA